MKVRKLQLIPKFDITAYIFGQNVPQILIAFPEPGSPGSRLFSALCHLWDDNSYFVSRFDKVNLNAKNPNTYIYNIFCFPFLPGIAFCALQQWMGNNAILPSTQT